LSPFLFFFEKENKLNPEFVFPFEKLKIGREDNGRKLQCLISKNQENCKMLLYEKNL